MTTLFIHGLDSSGRGTKGAWFSEHFPEMLISDYQGTLEQRLHQLTQICLPYDDLTLVGSSFGGLMVTCYAMQQTAKCARLILLAPALNFEDFTPPTEKLRTPTKIIIGKDDTVTPPDLVLPLAARTFADLEVTVVDDDHMLHSHFFTLDWEGLLH